MIKNEVVWIKETVVDSAIGTDMNEDSINVENDDEAARLDELIWTAVVSRRREWLVAVWRATLVVGRIDEREASVLVESIVVNCSGVV